MGYAGGKEPFPTYRKMKDYTECVLVEYDPARISYEKLLAEFVPRWEGGVDLIRGSTGRSCCTPTTARRTRSRILLMHGRQREWDFMPLE